MKVYAALNSSPDYSAGSPSLKSIHLSLYGAIESLYPGQNLTFRKWKDAQVWEGPDGFGMIKEMDVLP